MTEEEAVEIVRNELLGDNSILVKLSLKAGIDEQAVGRLESAMEFLTNLYKNKDYVPKVIAGAFVDLTPWFERCLGLYPEEQQNQIFDLKERIVSLALTMFGVD